MGLQSSFGFPWIFALIVFCELLPTVRSQVKGCSVQDVDFAHCLDQAINASIDSACCEALNLVVQTGYICFCAMLSSSLTAFTTPLPPVLPLSNCSIPVPSFTLCRVLAPIPVLLPPDIPEMNVTQPSVPPPMDVLAPPAQFQAPKNLTNEDKNKTTELQRKPDSVRNSAPTLCKSDKGNETSNGKEKTDMFAHQILLLLLFSLEAALHG